MTDWISFDFDRILAVLQYLTILFFVAASVPLLARRRRLRRLAILVYASALLLALADIVLWLAGKPS